MNGQPLVSIITPVRNGERTVARAIDSVLTQDYSPIEYIIQDGASTDGTVEIIRQYEDRISSWNSEADRGPVDGANKALEKSTGEIVFFLGSDDILEKGIVSAVVELFSALPETEIVHGNFRYINNNSDEILICKPFPDFAAHPFRWPQIYVNTFFIRRSIFKRLGFLDICYPSATDYEFFLRCLKNNIQFAYLDLIFIEAVSGGISYESIAGYRELREIAQAFGRPASLAYLDFAAKVIERKAAKLLEGTHFGKIAKSFYARYRYPNITFESK